MKILKILKKTTSISKFSKRQQISLASLLIILISLPLAVFLVQQQQEYRGRAVGPEARPTNVKISNLHGGGFSISWTSSDSNNDNSFISTTGWIEYGTTSTNFDQKADDDRGGENFSSTTHHVSIFNLQAETTYYFKIKSGPDLYGLNPAGDRWVRDGTAKQQSTPRTLELTGNPHPIYGYIKNQADNKVDGALVYVRLKKDDSDTKSALMSTVTKSNEGWVMDAKNARRTGLGNFFDFDNNDRVLVNVQAAQKGGASANRAVSNSSPAPDIIVTPPTRPTATPTPGPTATPTPKSTATPTPKPTATPILTPSPTPTPTPYVEAFFINEKGSQVTANAGAYVWDGGHRVDPEFNVSQYSHHANYPWHNERGVGVDPAGEGIVVGVTPSPATGRLQTGWSLGDEDWWEYLWPEWSSGGRSVTFVIATPISTPSPTPTGIPTPTPTGTPTPTPISTPTGTPTPTPTEAPGMAHLTFKVKFQGINQQRADRTARVTLKQGGLEKYRFESVWANSDPSGIYSGIVTDITPGTYDVFVKGWAHLQKKFGGVSLVVGENSYNWSGTELLAGDFDNDNILNIEDVALILAVYTQLSVPVNQTNKLFDIDSNYVIDINDIAFVLTNYTTLEVRGDD